MTERLPIYEPPPLKSEEPLDAVELALVRFFVSMIGDEIREEEAARHAEAATARASAKETATC
jgi:hypothetical protein